MKQLFFCLFYNDVLHERHDRWSMNDKVWKVSWSNRGTEEKIQSGYSVAPIEI
jgi:hypothetical protein